MKYKTGEALITNDYFNWTYIGIERNGNLLVEDYIFNSLEGIVIVIRERVKF